MSPSYFINFDSPVGYLALSAFIAVLEAALNAYMDGSLRSITGGKYYPEGWS